jgi:hypothetical protein
MSCSSLDTVTTSHTKGKTFKQFEEYEFLRKEVKKLSRTVTMIDANTKLRAQDSHQLRTRLTSLEEKTAISRDTKQAAQNTPLSRSSPPVSYKQAHGTVP